MTAQVKTDPKQALAGLMGGAANQPMQTGTSADVDPMVRFDQRTGGRTTRMAKDRSLMSGGVGGMSSMGGGY